MRFVLPLLLLLHFLVSTSALSQAPAFSFNQKALRDAPPFPRTWVPLASIFELDPDRPTKLEFLGQTYVTYRDNNGIWVVMDETCPHRLAPLSEGRIDRDKNILECSYHGWGFNSNGNCTKIPQADKQTLQAAQKNSRCHIKSYPVTTEKNILFAWLWPEDPLTALSNEASMPENLLSGMPKDSSTYTRDLPYGWDTLLENIVDPSHVPWAHHGLQGKREDAIPINMTSPSGVDEKGFTFSFDDRTMKMRRHGEGIFKAPFFIEYAAEFENTTSRTFNLSTLMIPTKPGWSRIIVYGGPTKKDKNSKEKETFILKLFRILPTWLLHQFSNRFLDSDLAFLHFQEQERERRGGDANSPYFIPAPSDRCVAALRKWVLKYAHIPGPLPPAISDRNVLFNRWAQHSDHCRHCSAAAEGIQKWRKNTYRVLAVSIILLKYMTARFVVVGCLALLRILTAIEPSLRVGGFKHYKND